MSYCQGYPTAFEIYDEHGEVIAKIEAFDETSSTVKIDTLMTPETWAELASEIHKCLVQIHQKD